LYLYFKFFSLRHPDCPGISHPDKDTIYTLKMNTFSVKNLLYLRYQLLRYDI
jgi:hypothetical protein